MLRLDELASTARRSAAAERQQRAQAAKLDRLRRIAEPVTFDDLAGDGVRLTLRQAGEAVERAGGTLPGARAPTLQSQGGWDERRCGDERPREAGMAPRLPRPLQLAGVVNYFSSGIDSRSIGAGRRR